MSEDPDPAQVPSVVVDTSVAHPARVYDYWLGGTNNFEADREAAERVLAATPGLRERVRAGREFLVRVVRYLTGPAGIHQFLDLGTGIPSANNTHEVAQSIDPSARVVYVDNDPIVLAHATSLLASTQHGSTDFILADLRDPEPILARARQTLDFDQPIAVMLLGVLHLVRDEEDPWGIVERVMATVPVGSYLVISHPALDILPGQEEAQRRYNERVSTPQTLRTRDDVARFFANLELVEPGLVQVHQWRPDHDTDDAPTAHGALARKVA
jgi:S-adenosyl methyltransferase